MKFACCKLTTSSSGEIITCTKCRQNYHDQCLFATDNKKELKKHWKCPECSLLLPRQTNNDNIPIRSSGVINKSNENINLKTGGSSFSRIHVDTSCEEAENENNLFFCHIGIIKLEENEFKSALVPLKDELISIRQDFNCIKESLDFFNSKFDSLILRIEKCEKELNQHSEKLSEFEEVPASEFGNQHDHQGESGFGQQAATAQPGQGTALVKYQPVAGTDVLVKSGNSQSISIRHHCISCMKEYEGKSLEELRLEDYTAGRKGSNGVFGFQQTENKSLFNAP
ncbi:unnamed protein product, partial [Leptidea sinapis]